VPRRRSPGLLRITVRVGKVEAHPVAREAAREAFPPRGAPAAQVLDELGHHLAGHAHVRGVLRPAAVKDGREAAVDDPDRGRLDHRRALDPVLHHGFLQDALHRAALGGVEQGLVRVRRLEAERALLVLR